MTMQPSPWLWNFLKQYERFRPTAYLPTQHDKWTCGWGHTKGVTQATICTQAQAQQWLEDDVAEAVSEVNRLVKVTINQAQFDALVSLTFNAGPGPLLKTLGARLNAGDIAGAAAQFKKWDWQAGVEIEGLEKRRIAEMNHFLGTDGAVA